LYAQIAERIRGAIAAGELRPADALPSVRDLAAKLRVNPATVVQAYRDLENEGFVEIRHGTGSFVRELAPGRKSRERARQARTIIRRMLADARRVGLPLTDLQAAFEAEAGAKVP